MFVTMVTAVSCIGGSSPVGISLSRAPLSLPPPLPVSSLSLSVSQATPINLPAGRRAGGGPPQAWSKVHQKIQPGFPRGKQSSDDSSPSSSLLPLPNNLLPISSTHSHLPSPSIPPPMATDSQQKTYQTLPKATNGTKTASTKPHGRPVTVPSGNLPMATSRAPAGRELGVALHQVVRRSGEVIAIDTQVRRVSGRGGGGAGILGIMPPGFPGGKDPIPVPKPQKVSS